MAEFVKGNLVYEGKAKRVFDVQGKPELMWLEFKDSLTAFNAQKKGQFSGKGALNRDITSRIFKYLKSQGVSSHWVADLGASDMITDRLKMIALEVVVRNRVAGSLAKRFQIPEGQVLQKPLVEFFYKNDALEDPFINEEHAVMLGAATPEQLQQLKATVLKINSALLEFFSKLSIDLVDFKVEFGINSKGEIVLGDEITPDSCRLWEKGTQEKLDKDRFRRDLGKVDEAYQNVWNRIRTHWSEL